MDFVEKQWSPHASPGQKTALRLCYQRALTTGLDLDSLVVDLGQSCKGRAWRDDGLLPAGDGETAGMVWQSRAAAQPQVQSEGLERAKAAAACYKHL